MKFKLTAIIFLSLLLCLGNLSKLFANTSNQLLITEIGNHESSDLEWIEIYNNSNSDFNLNGLIFKEENVNHKTTIAKGSNVLKPGEYALIANNYNMFVEKFPNLKVTTNPILDSSWINLSNNGELLELYSGNQLLESVIYSSNQGDTSLERKILNQQYILDWQNHPEANSMLNKSFETFPIAELPIDTTSNQPEEIPTETETTPDEPNQNPYDINTESDPTDSIITTIENTEDKEPESPTIETTNLDPEIIYLDVIHYIEKPYILISEVSFNSSPDWIEIFIDPRNQELSLNNLEFEVDYKKTNLGLSGKINQPSIIEVNTNLVATSEQVSILYNGQIQDSVCWQNNAPTASELIEVEILKTNQFWTEDCLDSNAIVQNTSFYRQTLLPDSNTKSDFKKTNQPTKGSFELKLNTPPVAKIKIQNETFSSFIPFSLNLDGTDSFDLDSSTLNYLWDFNGQSITKANPDSVKFDKAGTYTVSLTVTDTENLSSTSYLTFNLENKPSSTSTSTNSSTTTNSSNNKILTATNTTTDNINSSNQTTANLQLFSFMPNPKGADTEIEWIEIINLDEQKINLDNYSIDDEDGGSKPFKLTGKSIEKNQTLKIFSSESKLSLGNTKDQVRLLFIENPIEVVNYETSKDDEIFLKEKNQWTRKISQTQDSKDSLTPSSPLNPEKILNPVKVTEIKKPLTNDSNIKNGDLSIDVAINEIFPNPKGADAGKEWIELYNYSKKDVNLGNWKIKANNYILNLENLTIKAESYLLIDNPKLKLPNSNVEIELYDFSNKRINSFQFENSVEGQSAVKYQQEILWSDKITPGKENRKYYEIEGKIIELNETNQTFSINGKSVIDGKLNNNATFQVYYTSTQAKQLKLNAEIHIRILNFDNKSELEKIYDLTVTNKDEYPAANQLEDPKESKIAWTLLIPLLGIPAIIYREKIKDIFNYIKNLN